MHNKKTEKARLAAEQAQERIDEMAKTSEYHVDEALRKASREAHQATKPACASHAVKNVR
jgi:hypothetical protein